MNRCLQLAEMGAGAVAPNPMVGAVLVYKDKIIGEGYHEIYGGPHAEVNCIASVTEVNKAYIPLSTLYVSLEPCAHFGKTPPCADLIIKNKIPKVIIGCRDPFGEVNGKGMEKLKAAGVEVETGILENECKELNKRFFTFHIKKRPYIILKWAQTADEKIASQDKSRLLISNEYSNRLVHKWRAEESAILVGTNTALLDNPELTTRFWPGRSPIRLVVDLNLSLPSGLNLFDGKHKTIVFNKFKHEEQGVLSYYQVNDAVNLVQEILNALYKLKIQSVMVEGGAKLLQSFIDSGLWDEARVITNNQLKIGNGLSAPQLQNTNRIEEQTISSDTIQLYKSPGN